MNILVALASLRFSTHPWEYRHFENSSSFSSRTQKKKKWGDPLNLRDVSNDIKTSLHYGTEGVTWKHPSNYGTEGVSPRTPATIDHPQCCVVYETTIFRFVVSWLKHFVGEATTKVQIPIGPLSSHAWCFHWAVVLVGLIKLSVGMRSPVYGLTSS